MSSEKVFVITGASRGLGLELVSQILNRNNKNEKVVAAARNPSAAEGLTKLLKAHPDRLTTVKLDVGDEQSVKSAAAEVEKKFPHGITHLINNAGIMGTAGEITSVTKANLLEILDINVAGPTITTNAFLPLLQKTPASTPKFVFNMSSLLGSIGLSNPATVKAAAYNVSKAALNMLTMNYVHDSNLKEANITFIPLHPGWVATDMGNSSGVRAPVEPEDSVAGLLKVIDGSSIATTGKFTDFEGKNLIW